MGREKQKKQGERCVFTVDNRAIGKTVESIVARTHTRRERERERDHETRFLSKDVSTLPETNTQSVPLRTRDAAAGLRTRLDSSRARP